MDVFIAFMRLFLLACVLLLLCGLGLLFLLWTPTKIAQKEISDDEE
jgi:hypothetical protein